MAVVKLTGRRSLITGLLRRARRATYGKTDGVYGKTTTVYGPSGDDLVYGLTG
ncbi:hypothetical protein ACP70R_003875 [Stipagrostis hirtigluma subsp. patula]